jgi:multidrug efflux pump subunit AcrA (membrane-fusion protein)
LTPLGSRTPPGTRLPTLKTPHGSAGTLTILARVLVPLVILAGSWALTEALVSSKPEVARGSRSQTVYPVDTTLVVRADHRPTIGLFGEIVPARVAELRAISAGEVVEVHPSLNVGGHVRRGEVLVRVDDFPYRGALTEAEANLAEAAARIAEAEARIRLERAALESAGEQAELAVRDLERAEQLAQSGNITDQAIDARRLLVSQRRQAADQIRHTIAAEEARLAQQRAAVDRLAWQRDRAERSLRDTVLRAPFDGVVMSESAAIGRVLNASDVVVALYEADALDVRFAISDLQYGRLLASGRRVEGPGIDVTWQIGDQPLRYEAVIDRIGAEIASARGGVDVFARLEIEPDTVTPRPGAFVAVEVPGLIHETSVRLPATALFGDHVFVVEDGVLRKRRAELLASDGADVIVDGDLASGERVMVTRLSEAGDGVSVTDISAGAPEAGAIAEVERGRRS